MTSESSLELSASELRSKLFKSLKEKGILQSVKAQLRNRLAQELQGKIGAKRNNERSQQDSSSIFLQVANSVVANHLQSCSYDYTFSVFISEGLGSLDKIISLKEVLQMLHIHSESIFYKTLNQISASQNSSGFLWCLLQYISESFNNEVKDIGVQTNHIEKEFQESLDQKLLDVERFQYKKIQHHLKEDAESLEAKVLVFQRKYDMQKRAELEAEIERFRSSELAMIRIEEREKYNKEISNIQVEFEKTYSKKLKDLDRELEELKRKSENQQQTFDKESFEQRQKILLELQTLKERELEVKRNQDIALRNLETYEKELKLKADQLQFKEETMKQHEEIYQIRLKDEIKRIKLEMIEDEAEKIKKLEQQEQELKEEKIQFAAQKEMYMKWKEEADSWKIQNQQLNLQLMGSKQTATLLQEQLFHLQNQLSKIENYKLLKMENLNLKKDIESLKENYQKSIEQGIQKEHEHKKVLSELIAKVSMAEEKRKFLEDQQHERNSAHQKNYNVLQKKYEVLSLKYNEMRQLYEDSLISQRELLRVVEELRSALFHANQEKTRLTKLYESKNKITFSQLPTDITIRRNMQNDFANEFEPNNNYTTEIKQVDNFALKKLEEEALELEKTYQQFLERQKTFKNKSPHVHFNIPTQFQSSGSMQSSKHSISWIKATNPTTKPSLYTMAARPCSPSSTLAGNYKESTSFGISELLSRAEESRLDVNPLVYGNSKTLQPIDSSVLTYRTPPQFKDTMSLTQFSLSETQNFKTLTQYQLTDSDVRKSPHEDLIFTKPVISRLDTLTEQSINIEDGEGNKVYEVTHSNITRQEELYLNKELAEDEDLLQETSIATFESPIKLLTKTDMHIFSTSKSPHEQSMNEPIKTDMHLFSTSKSHDKQSSESNDLSNRLSKSLSVQELRATDLSSKNVASEAKENEPIKNNVMAEYMEMLLQNHVDELTKKDGQLGNKTQLNEELSYHLSDHEKSSFPNSLKDTGDDRSISSGSFKW
ncbi:centriole and centriolar satellite protein OFD1 isoform X7 [Hydra vulgaris]|uniref:Centriole and centriolar satellite protein OFD1 isoform X7 n=1 Tax=Hydra vulgaris TaxID=6087 RepID=A0ABM4D457_HYDVU